MEGWSEIPKNRRTVSKDLRVMQDAIILGRISEPGEGVAVMELTDRSASRTSKKTKTTIPFALSRPV